MTDSGTAGLSREPYDALAQAKELLRSVRAGALATLMPGQASLLLASSTSRPRRTAARSCCCRALPPIRAISKPIQAFAAACANRRGRSADASPRHHHGNRRMYFRPGPARGAEGALFGKTSEIGALCGFRRLFILAGGNG